MAGGDRQDQAPAVVRLVYPTEARTPDVVLDVPQALTLASAIVRAASVLLERQGDPRVAGQARIRLDPYLDPLLWAEMRRIMGLAELNDERRRREEG